MRLPKILVAIAASFVLSAVALAETRVALVIGNGAYKHAPALANPKNDAEAVAVSLTRLKFDVVLGVDLDEPGMRRVLRSFAGKVEGLGKDDVALVFYAGHGLQVNGSNYIVPVDAKLEKESDLAFQAVSLDFLSKLLEQSPHTNIVILDSCRDNPLARTLARGMGTRSTGIGRGLAEMRGINDTLIVYATNPGNVALDGETKHSPFTEALLKHIERPGLEVRHMVAEVRAAVIAATKGKQVPWESASLTRQIYFAPQASPGATPAAPTPAPATPPAPTPDNESLFWQSIKDSKNAADFKDYLARWPQGTFAALAKRRLAELEKAADVTPPAPAPQKLDTPAPPAPTRPQRVSSFEVGQGIHGDFRSRDYLTYAGDVASARDCQAMCLKNPQCNAWQWHHANATGAVPRVCHLYRAATRLTGKGAEMTSGFIRTTPAAAPAPPAPAPKKTEPAPSPPAPIASERQSLVRELMRKARAKEKPEGICSRITWRSGVEVTKDWPPGTQIVTGEGGSCAVWVAGGPQGHDKNGRPCKLFTSYFCPPSSQCFSGSSRLCRHADGKWHWESP